MWPSRTYVFKHIDATIGALLCRALGRLSFLRHQEIFTSDIDTAAIRKILVIRPGGMGDMLLLLPVLKALQDRLPQAQIDIICEKRNTEVLDISSPGLRRLVYDGNPAEFLRKLSREQYDVTIDTEQFHHFSAVFCWISKAPVRIGFKINPVRNPLYTHLVNYDTDGPESAQFARLLSALGTGDEIPSAAGILRNNLPELPAPLLNRINSSFGDKPFAAIHPGATTTSKQWPHERFAELANLLHNDFDMGSLLIGGSDDAQPADSVQSESESQNRILSLAGELTLPQVAAALSRAAIFVGGDSGLAHLAIAVGVPTVVIFGPSDPVKWGLQSKSNAVVTVDLPCQPCCIFGYSKPCHSIPCMMKIDVNRVGDAVRKVLG